MERDYYEQIGSQNNDAGSEAESAASNLLSEAYAIRPIVPGPITDPPGPVYPGEPGVGGPRPRPPVVDPAPGVGDPFEPGPRGPRPRQPVVDPIPGLGDPFEPGPRGPKGPKPGVVDPAEGYAMAGKYPPIDPLPLPWPPEPEPLPPATPEPKPGTDPLPWPPLDPRITDPPANPYPGEPYPRLDIPEFPGRKYNG